MIENKDFATTLEPHLKEDISKEAKTFLEEAITNIKSIGTYVSKLSKKGTTLTIEPCGEMVINEVNIKKSLEKVIKREKDRDNTLEVLIDNDIWKWDNLKNITMPKITKAFTSTIHRFTQNVTDKQIHEEALKLSLKKKDWNVAEAWNIIISGIMAGEVDVKCVAILTYFSIKVQAEDMPFCFRAYRSDDGRFYVGVYRFHLYNEWGAGSSICLSN